mmetsp:Transcript_63261/g.102310  ORF Transcript_63261/g.102310 Transcript_63261/m.102310 type:complete len:210 (+) Transcript_63261:940-1569(+)
MPKSWAISSNGMSSSSTCVNHSYIAVLSNSCISFCIRVNVSALPSACACARPSFNISFCANIFFCNSSLREVLIAFSFSENLICSLKALPIFDVKSSASLSGNLLRNAFPVSSASVFGSSVATRPGNFWTPTGGTGRTAAASSALGWSAFGWSAFGLGLAEDPEGVGFGTGPRGAPTGLATDVSDLFVAAAVIFCCVAPLEAAGFLDET